MKAIAHPNDILCQDFIMLPGVLLPGLSRYRNVNPRPEGQAFPIKNRGCFSQGIGVQQAHFSFRGFSPAVGKLFATFRGSRGLFAQECILDLRAFKSCTAEDVAKRLMDYPRPETLYQK